MEYTPDLSKETQKIINGLSGRLRLTMPQTLDKIIETFTEIANGGLLCDTCCDETCETCEICVCNFYMERIADEARDEERFKRQLREGRLSA
jgi:hypothetical protein